MNKNKALISRTPFVNVLCWRKSPFHPLNKMPLGSHKTDVPIDHVSSQVDLASGIIRYICRSEPAPSKECPTLRVSREGSLSDILSRSGNFDMNQRALDIR